MDNDRIIGKKAIMPIIEKMYDIHTWPGFLYMVKKRNFPLRRTPSGKPMLWRHELIAYDNEYQKVLANN
ncbi:MAG: hypothetical protein M0R34_03330 [Candidatus Marinimicrobia bacterium]|jgi:hypothetical protein|nr:hypothetical protein [Candidatus Neomarinimicrobiota bacterium]MCK9483375.1 hypothetical protein [Candidatus Neomarinimicrobiota bacterium]